MISTLSKPYVTPRALLSGVAAVQAVAAGLARPLGSEHAFAAVELTDAAQRLCPAAECPPLWEEAFRNLPAQFAEVSLSRPLVMGVINVTPDSFSDGGKFFAADTAIAHGRALLDAGADMIDIGGESTRPGADPVSAEDEASRVVPVIRALVDAGACVSIDTRHASVMEVALAAGARIVNDVTALTFDPRGLETVARSGASVVLMHMQGEPRTMQVNPTYTWAPGDVFDYLQARIAACAAAGILKDRIAVDPGIGFGKNDDHNAQIFDHLALFHALGCALVVGASRKSFIGRMSQGETVEARLAGSLAAALHAVGQGAQILRAHDVAETRQALAVAGRIARGC